MRDLTQPLPTSDFQGLVAEYRARADDLTLTQIALTLAAYAVNLAQGHRPLGFELAHIVALAQRAGMPLDATAVRAAWASRGVPAAVGPTPGVARPRGLWARLRGMAAWRWS